MCPSPLKLVTACIMDPTLFAGKSPRLLRKTLAGSTNRFPSEMKREDILVRVQHNPNPNPAAKRAVCPDRSMDAVWTCGRVGVWTSYFSICVAGNTTRCGDGSLGFPPCPPLWCASRTECFPRVPAILASSDGTRTPPRWVSTETWCVYDIVLRVFLVLTVDLTGTASPVAPGIALFLLLCADGQVVVVNTLAGKSP